METATAQTATRQLADLPAPGGLPVVGNLLALRPERLHTQLEAWQAELGSPYRLKLGPQQVYVSADPEVLQTVLRDRPERYRRVHQIERCIAEMGSNGVFSVEGDAWRPQRRLVMEALNATHFRGFLPVIEKITARLLRHWQAAAAAGTVVDMSRDLMRFTVDVTTALAFGEDPNTMDNDGDVIQNHLAEVFPRLMARINAPVAYWRHVRLPADRRFDRSLAAIHAHVDRLIAAAHERLRAAPPGRAPGNVLESMLRASEQPGSQVNDAVVHANVMTLLLAGEDTTAHTLAWTLYFLAQHPHWQEQLHLKSREALGDAALPATLEQVRALDLLESAANEAQRLRPIAPVLFFEPNQDVVLDGVALKARTPLFFVLRPAMLDAAHFASPLEYRPDRWAPGHVVGTHNSRAFLQFGAGPRVCPGRHLAGVEVRMVLAMLMRNFRIELMVDPAAVREVLAFTMMPSEMPVRLHARAQAARIPA
ncbi:cytochrome P450 [Caenimonas sedimenti]|uniref:Cytochrome P450 n=1 Tax=Caenimonas sedimenti TaxID=2596921 RepID=A0A562ZN12_9BURK|nr:cytochrome P450 [Caenimonas sedimenti]TWO69807.1 cytochrome P450 [Caenimonas sedimenti]